MSDERGRSGELLRQVLDRVGRVVAERRLAVCIFDLDSTLFDTGHRNLRILREMAEHWREIHPLLSEIAQGAAPGDLGWNVMEMLRKRGFSDDDALKQVESFWMERFFTNEYVLSDGVVPGAAEYVTACHQQGALVYYLTGRHVGGMEVGTLQSLLANGFPWGSGHVILHLKPSFTTPDKTFKADALDQVQRLHGEVVATFENEPANSNLFRDCFPSATHFLLQTITSPNPETPHPDIHAIKNFQGWQ